MYRRYFIVFLGIIVGVSIVFVGVMILTSQKSVSSPSQLSDRAKEYLSGVRYSNSSLGNVNTDGPKNTTSDQITKKGCFSFKSPFQIRNLSEGEDCSINAYLVSPSGQISVSKREINQSKLEDVPAIRLRDRSPGIYQKLEYDSKGTTYTVYYKNEESNQEYVAFYLKGNMLNTLAFSAITNQKYIDEFKKLLDTYKLE